MIRDQALEHPSGPARPDYRAVGAVAIFVYFVLMSDLMWRDLHPIARPLTGVLAAGLVLLYVLRAPGRADRFDRNILLSLLVFIVASILSAFPRQSFDSVLVALVYVAGLFIAREVLARESARQLFMTGLMALSALLTITTAAQFIVPFVEWWALTAWTVSPPLDLIVLAQPWGYRHDMTLLLVLLYPSWWVGRVTRRRAGAALVIGTLTAVVAIIDGSRTIWLATAGGVAAVAVPYAARGFQRRRRRVAVLAACLGVVLTTLIALGFTSTLSERMFRLAPIAERGSMWDPLLDAWRAQPLVGNGPGSFPWVLQITDYFDTNSFAPRHADSAVVQLVAESGILGLVAALILLATIVPSVFQGTSRAAAFALTACLLSAVALNPTQLVFLMAVAIGWVAFAVPRESHAAGLVRNSTRLRALSVGTVSIVGLAFGATMVAEVAYTSARGSVLQLDFQSADASLELAARLDPGLAIYPRQLGTLRLISDDPEAAIFALERAAGINPSDDLAWRVLGLAYAEAGDWASSRRAIQRAIDMQRSDPTNLLLMVGVLRDAGDEAAARAVLAEIVQAWPMIVAAPGWMDFAAPSSTTEILSMARDRWAHGLPSPEPLVSQPLLLGLMVGLTEANLQHEPARMSSTLREAYVAVMRCDPHAAAALHVATDVDRRQPTYWALAMRLAELQGSGGSHYERLYRIMTSDPLLSYRRWPLLNPLHENVTGGSSADRWGYRRPPIYWPDTAWDVPSPRSGFARWHRQPTEALQEAGIEEVLNGCQAS